MIKPVLRFPVQSGDPTESGATPHDVNAQRCPRCQSVAHRSRSRNWSERILKTFRWERLYRCDGCGWRGWMMPMTVAEGVPTEPLEQPDLSSLDTGAFAASIVQEEPRRRRRRKRRR